MLTAREEWILEGEIKDEMEGEMKDNTFMVVYM